MAVTVRKTLVLLVAFMLTAPLYAQTFTTIDVPGAIATRVTAINSAGDMVGTYFDGQVFHGFLLKDGTFQTLDMPFVHKTEPMSINDAGQIVGYYMFNGQNAPHGFLFENGRFKKVNFPGSSGSVASSINNRGQIVGFYYQNTAASNGFMFFNGTFTTLNPPGDFHSVSVLGSNDRGDVSGLVSVSPGVGKGFRGSGSTFVGIVVPDAVSTYAWGISNLRVVVGEYVKTDGNASSFLLQNGAITTFDVPGALDTEARGINSSGQIVGSYDDANALHGFIRQPAP